VVKVLEGTQLIVEKDFVDVAFKRAQLDDFDRQVLVCVQVPPFKHAGGVALAQQVFCLEDVVLEFLHDAWSLRGVLHLE
jgi:hypothetical protein